MLPGWGGGGGGRRWEAEREVLRRDGSEEDEVVWEVQRSVLGRELDDSADAA